MSSLLAQIIILQTNLLDVSLLYPRRLTIWGWGLIFLIICSSCQRQSASLFGADATRVHAWVHNNNYEQWFNVYNNSIIITTCRIKMYNNNQHIPLRVLTATIFLSGESVTIPSALAKRTTPKVPFPVHNGNRWSRMQYMLWMQGLFDNSPINTVSWEEVEPSIN